MRDKRNACRLLLGESEEKTPLGRLRNREEDNIETDLKEMRWDGVDWVYLA
jgi:hypothetical protein